MPAGSKPGEHRGGRKPGTRNKRTQAVADKLEELGCDPVRLLVAYARNEVAFLELSDEYVTNKDGDVTIIPAYVPTELRYRAAKDLMPFIAPTMSAVKVELPRDTGNTDEIPDSLLAGFLTPQKDKSPATTH